ncbi:glycosyltransferase family 4 protein [Fictibacillus norfolkensis]|uniref:Glycosyltransferase family 4 protein n=1 Tax=Fictibacillus norfolkensis TaxID=2762233 RepID=A0ABR8SN41_9BACL|nr:glycosyltransferase family 4 protein [Fictibacillus norfolkensis]MBD7964914.1 glycosyltransferase family 4 protein [Fictibacillus norfolkensis]
MKKILIVSTVSRQFYLFEQGNIEVLKSLGYEVHAAANFSDSNERLDSLEIVRHHFDIDRSPFSLINIKAYKELKKIMKSEKFNVVHCHSPMGGVLARLVARSVGITPVIYTAHGFHFYKGAPMINWLVYYPVEKFLSKLTQMIITINQEDFAMAKKFNTNRVVYVPGIGVNTEKFNDYIVDRDKKRKDLNIPNETVVLVSVGEMIKRKNHESALKALSKVNNRDYLYLICGKGELDDYLRSLTKSLGIEDKVRFLGYRNDIPEICIASDIFLFPSFQEGLPVSVMEAMSAGLPVIGSEIRGNTDLIDNDKGGYLLKPEDVAGFAEKIERVISNKELRKKMGKYNSLKVKEFDQKRVKKIMAELYEGLGELI